MIPRLLACLAVVAALVAPVSAAPSPPFWPGATWTYRYTYTATRPPAAPVVGTLTSRYDGPVTYRGRTYFGITVTDTLHPDVIQQDYYTWTGTGFRQAAYRTETAGSTIEVVFDKTVPLDTAQRESGTAETYVNGADQGSFPWSTTGTALGTGSVTVPAGTFLGARKVRTTFRFGMTQQVQVADIAGQVDLRVDSSYYINGELKSKTSQELISGPMQ